MFSVVKSLVHRLALVLPWLILLVLGAGVVNVLVAWGACVLSAEPDGVDVEGGAASVHWPNPSSRVVIAGVPGAACDWYDVYIDAGAAERLARSALPAIWAESVRMTRFDGVGVRAGWPFRSLCAAAPNRMLSNGDPRSVMLESDLIVGAWRVPWGIEHRLLPWKVLWPGTVANILFYLAVVSCFVAGPAYLRRRSRRLRWACQQCGYPLGRQEVCTECGASVVG